MVSGEFDAKYALIGFASLGTSLRFSDYRSVNRDFGDSKGGYVRILVALTCSFQCRTFTPFTMSHSISDISATKPSALR